jgi:hypothetical protein
MKVFYVNITLVNCVTSDLTEIKSLQVIFFFANKVQTDSQVSLSPELRRPDHSAVPIVKV